VRHKFFVLAFGLVLGGCATAGPGARVNMGDPSTYVKVNFLKGNYDEVIRYSNSLGVIDERNDRLKILYYVALSQLEKKDYATARKTLILLKEKDRSKNYQDLADVRMADSYFLENNYFEALRLYEALPQKYPKSEFVPYIYYRLVLAAQKIGSFDQAKQYYGILTKTYPESFEAIRLASVLDPMDLEGYSVQVGSYSERQKAYSVQQALIGRGYDVSVRQSKKESSVFYRVRIQCKSRPQAESIASQLRLQGHSTKVYP